MSVLNFAVLAVIVQSLLFKLFHLHARKLQENGISPFSVLYQQRYAILPAGMLMLLTFNQTDFLSILQNPSLLWSGLLIIVLWSFLQYLSFVYTNAANSLSFLKVFKQIFSLPILLLTGWLLNGDLPNLWSILALGLLILALIIKPSTHTENKRNLLKYSVTLTVLLGVALVILTSIDGGLYRRILMAIPSTLFGVSLYTFFIMLGLNIFFLFHKPKPLPSQTRQQYKYLLWSIPVLWFLASIPEGYGYAKIPIYIFIAIGAVDFLIDIISDVKNRRITLNTHTVVFSILTLTSIVVSVISLH